MHGFNGKRQMLKETLKQVQGDAFASVLHDRHNGKRQRMRSCPSFLGDAFASVQHDGQDDNIIFVIFKVKK
jgi:hypothetical protein